MPHLSPLSWILLPLSTWLFLALFLAIMAFTAAPMWTHATRPGMSSFPHHYMKSINS